MSNEQWFQANHVVFYEDRKSHGLEGSSGSNSCMGLSVPNDEDVSAFFYWGNDGWCKYYVIRRYGLDISVDVVQSFYAPYVNEPIELSPGVGAFAFTENDKAYVQLFSWDSSQLNMGPITEVMPTDPFFFFNWYEPGYNVAIGSYETDGLMVLLWGTSGIRGRYGFQHAFALYRYDSSTLTLTLDVPHYVCYNEDFQTSHPYPLGYGVSDLMYKDGFILANANKSRPNSGDLRFYSTTPKSGVVYSFDGSSVIPVEEAALNFNTGRGTSAPGFRQRHYEILKHGPLKDYMLINGWGVGNQASGADIGLFSIKSGEDPFYRVPKTSGVDGGVYAANVAAQESFDLLSLVVEDDTEIIDTLEDGYYRYTFLKSTPSIHIYGVDDSGLEPTMGEVASFSMPVDTFYERWYYTRTAVSGRYNPSGFGVSRMNANVSVAAYSSMELERWAGTKNYRVFVMFYKQGADIPKLQIPRKRWAYPQKAYLESLMDRYDIPEDARATWLEGLVEWSTARGRADEEVYLALEAWVKELRLQNGQTD